MKYAEWQDHVAALAHRWIHRGDGLGHCSCDPANICTEALWSLHVRAVAALRETRPAPPKPKVEEWGVVLDPPVEIRQEDIPNFLKAIEKASKDEPDDKKS